MTTTVAELRKATCTTLLAFLQENYNQVTLSIEVQLPRACTTPAPGASSMLSFLKQEYMVYFSRIVAKITDENESRHYSALITRYDYLFQIHDSIKDLFKAKRAMNQTLYRAQVTYPADGAGAVQSVRCCCSTTSTNRWRGPSPPGWGPSPGVAACAGAANRKLLFLLAQPDRRDAGAMSNFMTYSRRLMDKLVNFANLSSAGRRTEGSGQLPVQADAWIICRVEECCCDYSAGRLAALRNEQAALGDSVEHKLDRQGGQQHTHDPGNHVHADDAQQLLYAACQ